MSSMLRDAFGDLILVPNSKSTERLAERRAEGLCLLIRFRHIVLQQRHQVFGAGPFCGHAVIGYSMSASLHLKLKNHQIRPC